MIDYDYNAEDRKFQAMDQLPVLLTPKDVMDILGAGKNTVYRLLNSGELPAVRIGRGWRIPDAALRSFMDTPL